MKRVGRDLLSKLMQSEAAVFEREAKQLTRPLNGCKVQQLLQKTQTNQVFQENGLSKRTVALSQL